ncbi:MAG: phenylalanine--tRNA ligase subunit beta [Betaproteobacteria bacterium RIFCSPLOWO2_12_FULL_65_14]|nr:MAG: phenylalanine--tRNA ligase subunit beta [Betaproteobacteria bacterium RIFCSPLOWO2_12_FULL_65_14]
MNVPESWLRSFCNPPIPGQALADRLTMAGLEVEAYAPYGPQFSGVVVGEILSVNRHPGADKLTVCRVHDGSRTLEVVCGAPNVRAGMKAPLATIGAKLPGMEIRKTSLRGVDSDGMLCSARELGLSNDHSGLLELAPEAKPGEDLRPLLGLDDRVLTLKLTPNRADALSILGVAREVSALTGVSLERPRIDKIAAKTQAKHPVRITAPEGCGRFTGRVIRNVNAAAPSPRWMKERLERAGQRSISALVDVTNYVMLELGRPLHVYDLDKLKGPIDVRWGRKGEKVLLLNEQEVEVDESVLCITDDSGAIGLGGIMGGESTKADEATRNVLLESAFFFPAAIAGRARRYNFSSDAAHRFERGVDFDNNVDGIERATRLILDICGGEPGPTDDLVARLPERKPVAMRVSRAQKVIGIPISGDEIAQAFTRLGLRFQRHTDAFVVEPPSFRFDLEIEEDLIEEVARIHGFERIAAHPPRAALTMLKTPESVRSAHTLRERMAAADYREVINFSFVEPAWEADFADETNPIRLLNPIASQLSVMRTSLIGSLVDVVRKNHFRKVPRIRVFEIGRVFLRDAAAPDGPLSVAGLRQPLRIAAAAYGRAFSEQWDGAERAVDFFDVRADIEALVAPLAVRFETAVQPAFHPGRCAKVLVEGKPAGWIGELHPKWLQKYELPQAAILFELEVEPLLACPLPRPEVPSRFPPVVRDIALVFDARTPVEAVFDAIRAEKPPIVRSVRLFSLYRGAGLPQGKKSLAFRVVMQHTERTLTDAEADAARDALVALLGRRFSATLRT